MSFFRRFRGESSALDQHTKQTTATYLCRLMEEQNALLRELILVTSGHQAQARVARPVTPAASRPRTDKDVSRVTRESLIQDRQRQEREGTRQIPANGPVSKSDPRGPVEESEPPKAI